jgi:putative SOS response-associated peptidase YedK
LSTQLSACLVHCPNSFIGFRNERVPKPDAVLGDRAYALGMFGMGPHWAKLDLARQTYHASTERAMTQPGIRNAYKMRQFCIIPASLFYEPNYVTGKAVRGEIPQAD